VAVAAVPKRPFAMPLHRPLTLPPNEQGSFPAPGKWHVSWQRALGAGLCQNQPPAEPECWSMGAICWASAAGGRADSTSTNARFVGARLAHAARGRGLGSRDSKTMCLGFSDVEVHSDQEACLRGRGHMSSGGGGFGRLFFWRSLIERCSLLPVNIIEGL